MMADRFVIETTQGIVFDQAPAEPTKTLEQ